MWRPPKIPFSPGQALFQSQHASVESTTQRKAYSFNWQTSNGSLFSPSQPPSLCSAVASEESPLTCNDMTVHMHGSHRETYSWGYMPCSPQLVCLKPILLQWQIFDIYTYIYTLEGLEKWFFSHGTDAALGQVLKSIKGVQLFLTGGNVPKPCHCAEFYSIRNSFHDGLGWWRATVDFVKFLNPKESWLRNISIYSVFCFLTLSC